MDPAYKSISQSSQRQPNNHHRPRAPLHHPPKTPWILFSPTYTSNNRTSPRAEASIRTRASHHCVLYTRPFIELTRGGRLERLMESGSPSYDLHINHRLRGRARRRVFTNTRSLLSRDAFHLCMKGDFSAAPH